MILPELFDTHVHLDDPRFQVDRKEVIQKLPEQGITRVINVGADRKSSQASIRLAEEHDFIYASVGIHPHDSKDMTEAVSYTHLDVYKRQRLLNTQLCLILTYYAL